MGMPLGSSQVGSFVMNMCGSFGVWMEFIDAAEWSLSLSTRDSHEGRIDWRDSDTAAATGWQAAFGTRNLFYELHKLILRQVRFDLPICLAWNRNTKHCEQSLLIAPAWKARHKGAPRVEALVKSTKTQSSRGSRFLLIWGTMIGESGGSWWM